MASDYPCSLGLDTISGYFLYAHHGERAQVFLCLPGHCDDGCLGREAQTGGFSGEAESAPAEVLQKAFLSNKQAPPTMFIDFVAQLLIL